MPRDCIPLMSRLARALGAACVAVAACSWKLQSAGPLTAPCASRSRARIQLDKTVDGEIRAYPAILLQKRYPRARSAESAARETTLPAGRRRAAGRAPRRRGSARARTAPDTLGACEDFTGGRGELPFAPGRAGSVSVVHTPPYRQVVKDSLFASNNSIFSSVNTYSH